MPTPSARSATRAVAVLDYFTTHPTRPCTLSELAVEVGASPSSLTSVLQALTDTGYLVRHPRHKTYELGPALIAVGRAASGRHPVVDLARPELRGLAERFDADCVGSVLVADEILILVVEGRASQNTRGVSIGHRIPLVPPFGEIWLAHSEPDAVRRWLAGVLPEEPDEARSGAADTERRLHEVLRRVRERGFAVNLRSEWLDAFQHALLGQRAYGDDARGQLARMAASYDSYELLDESPDATYEPEMIIAPVFGPDASVVFAITLTGLKPCTGSEIDHIAAGVAETGLWLTRAIGGRVPSGNGYDRTA
ncbi:IclR family transcriptional regulator [Amycolatopsis sp. GM8]|uniref:IclR family transcriptional regulator n=1 Tax=Amycolatopsis sp. GM8 TaxID=2896530 RepID=UPI001F0026FC|nr:helix-turn-helix domain-containing protein [Amycolatopsis sp. GM8]